MAVETVAEQDLSLEEALAQLEGLTDALERGVGLEEEVEKFVRGRGLLAQCECMMREVESRFQGAGTPERVLAPVARSNDEAHPGEDDLGRGRERTERAEKEERAFECPDPLKV